MMTEDQARTKWCPFARVDSATENSRGDVIGIAGGGNRMLRVGGEVHASPVAAHCIGSACMAWRWQEVSGPFPSAAEALEEPPYGYCGLAGRPA